MHRAWTTIAATLLAFPAAGCSGPDRGDQDLAAGSGVAGAGAGPSTAAALLPAGGGKGGLRGTESTQTDDGPNAGGPH